MTATPITAEILKLDHRGEGMTAEGYRVPRALPGEAVEGIPADGRIADPRILRPVPDRVRPVCRHYRACGGCALQHAADGFVSGWKLRQVQDALSMAGIAAEVRLAHVSPPGSRRRAVLAGRRLKSGAMVGFHGRASDQLVAVPDCRLLRPELVAALPAFEAVTALGASRRGELTLAVTRSDAGPDLAVTGGRPADAALRAGLAALAEVHGIARIAWDGEIAVLRAPPAIAFGRASVVPPPGGFLQATEEGEAALAGWLRGALAGAGRIAELFAGCGTFTLPLAETAALHAVEADAAALAALDAGWRGAAGLKRVTTEARDLFRRPLLADELDRFDAVALDPPRAGAAAQVAEIARSRLPLVAHVSCNPATFARDAATLLAAGFRIGPVAVFDQFRWSSHVELAARFDR